MVSFIVPYIDGREEHFAVNLTSLELQTDQNFEVICIYQDPTITNPSAAFNFGVAHSHGEILCLTSPEVIQASTWNVAYMSNVPRGTYWVGKVLEPNGGKVSANCTEENWKPWKYFLGVLHKEDYIKIGGMDEEFMEGIAWEDRDFADRATQRLLCDFNPNIVGIHLPHSRSYQDNHPELRAINRKTYMRRYNARKMQSKNKHQV